MFTPVIAWSSLLPWESLLSIGYPGRQPVYLRYLDLQQLEGGAVLEAHVGESSSKVGDQVQDDV